MPSSASDRICGDCVKYPDKFRPWEVCKLCKKECCPHKSEWYESMSMNETLYKIDYYWYSWFICHACIIQKLIE